MVGLVVLLYVTCSRTMYGTVQSTKLVEMTTTIVHVYTCNIKCTHATVTVFENVIVDLIYHNL